MISEEKLGEIRQRLPISELVSDYVQLKKSGKSYKGVCPFHQEKTPSFYVNDERESFHCFGCGTGGDLFEFLKKIEDISFPEAVERLAERLGITIDVQTSLDGAAFAQRKREYEISRQAAWYYHKLLKNLPQDHEVWKYLKTRQIPTESVDTFFLGFCPNQDSGLGTYLKNKGNPPAEIRASHLFKGDREFFRGRLIFPIFRGDKKVVGFGGRKISDKDFGPKYLNSPESPLFKKGELFYGLDLAKGSIRQTGQALLVEGYLDVITLHGHGIPQAVAPLGTALTSHQARTLARLAEEIILLFDGDSAGQQATLRALEALLLQGKVPHRVLLESGEDPDSYLKRYGTLAFEKKLKAKRNLLEELIDKGATEVTRSLSGLDKKGQTAAHLMALIEKIPDTITRNLYRRHLSEAFEIPEEWVRERPIPTVSAKSPERMPVRVPWLPEEETLLEIWLKFPNLRAQILKSLRVEDFCTMSAREVAESFWELATRQPEVSTGKYFDLAPPGLIGVLSKLAVRSNGLEEESAAEQSLEQSILRLKEKRLRMDLQDLKSSAAPEQVSLIQQKIDALSQVLKNKERIYGER